MRLARDLTVDIRAELLQRCCLCRQWIASPSHIKSHIRRSHPTVFEAYFQDITQQCGLMSSLIHDPCPFCLQPVQSKHRDRHATRCPVLLQVALCCVQNGHDTARNRLTLRGTLACLPGQSSARPAGLSGSGQLSEHSGTNTHRGGKPSSQVAETERQGGSTTAVAAGKPRSFLLEWMERQQSHPATSSAGNAANVGTAHLEAGGCHQCVADGSGVPPAVQNLRPGDGRPHTLRDCHGMAPEEGKQPGGPPSTSSPPEEFGLGNEDETGASGFHPGPSGKATKTGMGQSQRGQAPILVALGLQLGKQDGNRASYPRPSGARGSHESPGHIADAYERANHATLSQHEASRGTVQRGDAGIHAGDISSGTGGTESSRGPGIPVPRVGLALHRSSPADGDSQEISLGEPSPEDAAQTVQSLVLQNPHNYCYQHVTVLTWMWAMIHNHMAQARRHLDADLVGKGYQLLQQLLRLKPRRLYQAMAWATFTQAWPRPQMQHDVGEFLTYILRRLKPPCMQGTWQSRLQDPTVRVYDSGTLLSPLVVLIPQGAHSVQDCVNARHSQMAPHGLAAPTSTILLQLSRFHYQPGRPVRKLQVRLETTAHLRFPVFSMGLQTQWYSYYVIAGIYHIGRTPSTGHYRAFLTNRGVPGNAGNLEEPYIFPDQTMVTDDGVPAQNASREVAEQIFCNIYMLWCVRNMTDLQEAVSIE